MEGIKFKIYGVCIQLEESVGSKAENIFAYIIRRMEIGGKNHVSGTERGGRNERIRK